MAKAKQRARARGLGRNTWLAVGAVVLVAGLVGAWLMLGTAKVPDEINVAQVVSRQAAGAFILDVREPSEWAEYHIPGATLIPLGELPARASELQARVGLNQEIVVVCHSGNRSQRGRDALRAAGFTNVTSMAGGLMAWQGAGHATVSGP